MFRKLFLAALVQLSYSTAFSQSMDTRQVEPFTGIKIDAIAKVHLRQDQNQLVQVVDKGIGSSVELHVKNGILRIDGSPDAELFITMPAFEQAIIEGNGEIIGDSPFKGDQMSFKIGGNGKIEMEVHAKSVNASISGLGKIILHGTADQADISISGSGKVDALDLTVASCTASISGLGKCLIDVTDNLDAQISGSGTVTYKNPPKNIVKNVTGVGKIQDVNTTSVKADTTHLTFGSTDIFIVGKKDSLRFQRKQSTKPIWGGVELGFNSWVNADGKFEVPDGYSGLDLREEKSMSVSLNLLQQNIQFGKSNFWFMTGLGVTWNNYRFKNNVSLNATDPISTSIDSTSDIKYIKSKLVASYLMAPLMFEVFTSKTKKNAFHIGAGAMVGVRLGSHTKMKYEEDGNVHKPKSYDSFNLNPFRYGVRVAAGYGDFNVFADYYMSPVFKDKKGPTLYPVNFGITLAGW